MKNLALFDFDSTITAHDTFVEFVASVAPKHRFLLGKVLLTPLAIACKAGFFSGHHLRAAVVRLGLQGLPCAEIERRGEDFASRIDQIIRPEAQARLAWHRANQDEIAVVSGALDIYLKPWCEREQLHCLCSQLEQANGVYTGRYLGAQCVAEEKASRVRAQFDLTRYQRIYAYGDSADDAAMLALAHVPVFRWQNV